MGTFHTWSISWCPVPTHGIQLPYWILKIRKQKSRLHKLLPVTSLFGSREKRGNEFLWAGSHRDPPLGQTGLLSTRAWVQAGKMLSAPRWNVFGKPERWRKRLHAADSRECSKNFFCTLRMQCHHPETLNCQVQTEKQNVWVYGASLKPSPKRTSSRLGPVAKTWVLQADRPGPQSSSLSYYSIYLIRGSLSPSTAFLLCTLIATRHITYFHLCFLCLPRI